MSTLYNKTGKDTLVELCQYYDLDSSGGKIELIERLQEKAS